MPATVAGDHHPALANMVRACGAGESQGANLFSGRFVRGKLESAFLAFLFVLLARCPAAQSESGTFQLPAGLRDSFTLVSKSQQFVVHSERPASAGLSLLKPVGTDDEIEPDPRILVVIADRVKSAVLRKIDLSDRWRGKIHLNFNPAGVARTPVRIVPERFNGVWRIRIHLPRKLPWTALTRGLTEAVLLEIANRGAGSDPVPVPLWIAEGLHQLLLEEDGRNLISEPYTVSHTNERKREGLRLPREVFQTVVPLGFAELGMTGGEATSDPAVWKRFQASAQLFTHELLASQATRGIVRNTLLQLPQSLNWQTVFLQAAKPQFLTFLEVEKWWAVSASSFRDGPVGQPWSDQRVLSRLKELTSETTDIRSETNAPWRRVVIPLTQVITEWPLSEQEPVIRRKLGQLRLLASHSSPTTLPILQEYFRALERLSSPGLEGPVRQSGRNVIQPSQRLVMDRAVRELKALDVRLDARLK